MSAPVAIWDITAIGLIKQFYLAQSETQPLGTFHRLTFIDESSFVNLESLCLGGRHKINIHGYRHFRTSSAILGAPLEIRIEKKNLGPCLIPLWIMYIQ